jgi:hypothetical protein
MIILPVIILKRLEVFFLDEWIEHHLNIGVSKIIIYDNGFKPHICPGTRQGHTLGDDEPDIWIKKPDANYFFEFSDAEIDDALCDVVSKYGDSVEVISWVYGVDHDHLYPLSQGAAIGDTIEKTFDAGAHILAIDPDEYINLCACDTLQNLLATHNARSIIFGTERIFRPREFGLSVRSIYQYETDNHTRSKWLFLPKGKPSICHIHKPPAKHRIIDCPKEDALRYHYPATTKEFLNFTYSNFDDTMKRHIE